MPPPGRLACPARGTAPDKPQIPTAHNSRLTGISAAWPEAMALAAIYQRLANVNSHGLMPGPVRMNSSESTVRPHGLSRADVPAPRSRPSTACAEGQSASWPSQTYDPQSGRA